MRVAAFTRYGRRAASTRQRFLQYLPALRAAGIEVEHHALLDDDYVAGLVTSEPYPRARVASAYAQRLAQLAAARSADVYWVYVELLPFVPAALERLASLGKPVVYDFDDAFFHKYDQSGSSLVRAALGEKHASLLRHAAACCCGNAYLRDFAVRYCPDSIILPTVVDTAIYRPAARPHGGALTIGWIGSPSTWVGVRPILPLLADTCTKTGARFLAIGAGRQGEADRFPGMETREWSEATEVADVQAMDVGIMPLLDRDFERGKSGYKLIQYMACGLPVIASRIGVNAEIVEPAVNGLLASSDEQWRDGLTSLLSDAALRRRMGRAGRKRVESCFSLASQQSRLVEVFNALAPVAASGRA